jgi:hypothetical protein
MRRRTFLFGSLGAVGGAGLLASGKGFSREEAQRAVSVEVVGDENAYVRLEYLDQVLVDGIVGDCRATREFITITNQSKVPLTDFSIDIELDSTPGYRIVGVTTPEELAVGEVGVIEVTFEAVGTCTADTPGTVTIDDFEIEGTNPNIDRRESFFDIQRERALTLAAECYLPGKEISFIAFCPENESEVEDLQNTTIQTCAENQDGETTAVRWDAPVGVDEVVVYGGREWYLCDGGRGGIAGTNEQHLGCNQIATGTTCVGDSAPFRCPNSPCLNEESVKFEGEDGFGSAEITQDTCSGCSSEKEEETSN